MLICIGGVCVPYTAVVPIVILALKWMLDKLGLAAYLPQFVQDLLQVKGIPSPSEKSIETTTEEEFATSAAGPSKVQPLESVEELEELLQNKKVKVVCKFTSTWCVPCKKVQPFFEQCSGQPQYQKKKDGSNVFFRTVDVDEFDELASKYKISMMPTFVVLQGDKILGTYSGSNEHELGTFLKEHAASKAAKDISLKAFREEAEESNSKDIDLKEAKEESSKYEEEPVPVLDDENDDGDKDEAELKEKSAPALSDEAQEAVRDDDVGKMEESIPVADAEDKPEEVSKEAVTEEVETPAPIITGKEEKVEPIASKLEDPREKDAEEVPKSEAAMRQNMIETELNAMIDEMMKSEDFEEEDEMEKESYDALMKAAKEICYTRKYYDVSSDKIIYFPSIIKTIVNMDLFEKAETYYFEEEDEFPMLYSMGLRQIAFDKMDAEGGGDEENEELDDDMMERLSMAVQLTETDMDELREALAAAEAEDALDTIDESEDVSNSVPDEKLAEVSKEAVAEEVETPAPTTIEKEEKVEEVSSPPEDPREKDAEEVPKSEAAMRQNMIETELNAMIDEMMKSEDFEEEDEMEKESYDALMKAAKEICYTRKYYDVSSDKIVYFPSIIKTIVNMDLFEKAETYYFEEEDEFPMLYSMGLRQIAFDKMDAEGGGDEENEELDDDMMERLSMAVQLTETDMDELRDALAAAEADDALDAIDESEDVSNSVPDERPEEVSKEAVTEEVGTPATSEKEEKAEPIATTKPSATSDEETRNPLIFPCLLEPPTGSKLTMPFAPFRKEDEDKDYSDLKAKTTEAPATKPVVTKAPPAKDTDVKENTSKTAPVKAETARNPLLFPSFLAPPTGTTLSMPFAPFRKEDEGKDAGGLKAKKAYTAANTNKPPSTEEELNSQIAELGEQIKKAKQEKKPKEEWDPILKEMLALKAKFKEVTGRDHGAAPKEEKKEKNSGQQEASDKNKEKRAAKAAAKAKKEAEKASKRAERERREREKAEKLTGVGQDNFGDVQMVQSQEITDKKYTEVANLKPSLAGHKVLIRGYLQVSRGVGKGVFVLIRSTLYTVQAVAFQNDTVSQGMVKYITGLPVESVVEVEGIVTVPDSPVESATQKMVEIQITAFRCVSKAKQALPFLMEDACRPDERKETDVGAYDENEEVQRDDGLVRVGDKNRLDNRWLDLRTPANQSIMRIESMVGCLFRECLLSKGFVEIHTPKLIAGASEGGADVFTLDYFGQPACLAMSPQLHKQMAAACSGFERVFTTGPVFRAENSNTRRHLCEFTGFDMEMAIHEHYDEVMDVFSDLFIHIFDGLNARCKEELERIREQHPFEDLKYLRPTLKLTYAEGCALLREAGIEQDDYEDLSTENEKKLGDIVKEKYDTDFFFMDKYPLSVRPFYTMPCPENPKLSNSYDFFIRGQEILSGAQRIHDPDLLEERAKEWGIDVSTIAEYVNSFKNGALPHGGGGIGLERVVMLFLGLPNIRKAAWFPRDPRRLRP